MHFKAKVPRIENRSASFLLHMHFFEKPAIKANETRPTKIQDIFVLGYRWTHQSLGLAHGLRPMGLGPWVLAHKCSKTNIKCLGTQASVWKHIQVSGDTCKCLDTHKNMTWCLSPDTNSNLNELCHAHVLKEGSQEIPHNICDTPVVPEVGRKGFSGIMPGQLRFAT
jgi:hypothetical protein